MLIVIDSYLSNEERRSVCRDLIQTIQSKGAEVLLINKHPDFCDLGADHYLYFGHSFSVGRPPQELLDSHLYELPYTYIRTNIGTLENWHSLVGVTDHVANIFNTFVLSSKFAEALGETQVLRIEYDTVLSSEDLDRILEDLNQAQDYLFYGTRREGDWAKEHQYLVDVHVIGYSPKIFSGEQVLRNDTDFWDLCRRIGYYGKWIEYVIPSLVESKRASLGLQGSDFPVPLAAIFPKSQFDTINAPGEWSDSWDVIPKVCRLAYPEVGEQYHKVGLFYWNGKDKSAHAECQVLNSDGALVHHSSLEVHPGCWVFQEVDTQDYLEVIASTRWDQEEFTRKLELHREDIPQLTNRFVFS